MMRLRKMVCLMLCMALLTVAGTAWGQEEAEGYRLVIDNMEMRMGAGMRYTLRDLAMEMEEVQKDDQHFMRLRFKNLDEDLMAVYALEDQEKGCFYLDGLNAYLTGENLMDAVKALLRVNDPEGIFEELELETQEAEEATLQQTAGRIRAIGEADLAGIYRGSLEYQAEHGLGVAPQGETTVEIGGQTRSATHYKMDQSPEDVRKSYEEYDSKHPECDDYVDFAQYVLSMAASGPISYMSRKEMYEKSDYTIEGDSYLAQDGSLLSQYHVSVSARAGYEEEISDNEYDAQTLIADGWLEVEFQQEGVQTRIRLPLKPGEGLDGAVCELKTDPVELEISHNMEGADWADEIQMTSNVRVEYIERDGLGQFTALSENVPIFPAEVDERIAQEREELTGLEVFVKTETEQYKEVFEAVLGYRQDIQAEIDPAQRRADIEIKSSSGGQNIALTMTANVQEIDYDQVETPDWSQLEAITLENAEDKQEEWTEAFEKWTNEVLEKASRNDALKLILDGFLADTGV